MCLASATVSFPYVTIRTLPGRDFFASNLELNPNYGPFTTRWVFAQVTTVIGSFRISQICWDTTNINFSKENSSMTTATKEKVNSIGGIPIKAVETEGITSAPKARVPRFTQMALESTDFVCKLKAVQPVVFFSATTDERGNIVLDVFADFGYFNLNGLRVRQQPGQIQLQDGSTIDNFSVSLRGVPSNPQFGACAHLSIHREEKILPNGVMLAGGTFIVGQLTVHRIGELVWRSYCKGEYSGIDHEKAGVKRLSSEELQARIASAIAARTQREAQKAEITSKPPIVDADSVITCA